MAFREKTAWLTLISMLVAYTLYFGLIAGGHPAGYELFAMLWLFGAISLTQLVVVIAGSLYLTARTPKEERARPDERDRAIGRRGAAAGYYVLLIGTIVAAVVMPFLESGARLANIGLFALVTAEAVHHLVILTSYRRGWHG